MKIKLIQVGKTRDGYLKEGIAIFEKRIAHYLAYEVLTVEPSKSSPNAEKQKQWERDEILKWVSARDFLILLDEKGETFTSVGFSEFMKKRMAEGQSTLCFVIGGAFGFDALLYKKCDTSISLSSLTFTHQMVRLFFTEQIYRSLTIIKGEGYHHE